MAVFGKVGKFLSSKGVRGVAALAGGVSALGGFDGVKIGGINASTIAGGANLLTGGVAAARGDVGSGLAQAALGGFNVLQNNTVGGVGNFGNIQQVINRNFSTSGGQPSVSQAPSSQQGVRSPAPEVSNGFKSQQIPTVKVENLPPVRATPTGTTTVAAPQTQPQIATTAPAQPIATATPPQTVQATPDLSGATPPATPEQPGGFFQKVARGVSDTFTKDPIGFAGKALTLGGTLYSLTQPSYQDMVNPNSPFAREYIDSYKRQNKTALDNEYAKAKATLQASFANRGMTDSTIAQNAMLQLDKNYAESVALLDQRAIESFQAYVLRNVQGAASANQIERQGLTTAGYSVGV